MQATAGDDLFPSQRSPPSTTSSAVQRTLRRPDPPRTERAVVSRTRFQITLPSTALPSGSIKTTANDDQHGWSSPHGEPYRPLGRPELNLKFSPQLVYGVSQNVHRARAMDSGSGPAGDVPGNNLSSDKDQELREPTGTVIATLVNQFVTSMTSRKWSPMDERRVKLAHRLQASVGGFSPERTHGLHRHRPHTQGQQQEDVQQNVHLSPRAGTSVDLLREAINEGTSRLRSARNGASFLQSIPSIELYGLCELQERYLHARASPLLGANNGGIRTNQRGAVSPKTLIDDNDSRHKIRFNQGDRAATNSCDIEDGQAPWYLSYTTRELQRSPHRCLPSLKEFQARTRDEKQPLRPLRAHGNMKGNPSTGGRARASTSRSSFAYSRTSVVSSAGNISFSGGDDALSAVGKVVSPATRVPPMHNVEKLQAAVNALETVKHQQSARLATTLDVLEQGRRECLTEKFRSLDIHCDVKEDLRQMRERSEYRRGQRVHKVVSNLEDWYPELLRRLVAREIGPPGNTAGSTPQLHPAEIFVVQAVRQFSNAGCEFQPNQLFHVARHIHPDDFVLPQVQQLLEYLRNALQIENEHWIQFVASMVDKNSCALATIGAARQNL